MDKAEFTRINKQLDSLDDRVRKVIARRKPLELDQSPRRSVQSKPVVYTKPRLAPDPGYSPGRPAIATGQLTGNELPFYEPPGCREEAPGFDYTRDVIFAEFNR